MGTWGIGHFDNDTAADWCGSLDDTSLEARQGLVHDTLAGAVDTTDELDADDAAEAVAAAALVAAQFPGGELAHPHYGPDEPLPDLTGLRALALQALDRVVTEPSELLELWEESGEDNLWQSGIDRLRTVLAPIPPGGQLAPDLLSASPVDAPGRPS